MCKKEFSLTAEFFHRSGTQNGGFQTRCKTCACKYASARYYADPAKHRKNAKERVWALSDKVRKIKSSTACADCGGIFPPVCMDFDHVRGIKRADISYMVQKTYTWTVIEEEIAKCELVCANCHRIRTEKTVNVRGAGATLSTPGKRNGGLSGKKDRSKV